MCKLIIYIIEDFKQFIHLLKIRVTLLVSPLILTWAVDLEL